MRNIIKKMRWKLCKLKLKLGLGKGDGFINSAIAFENLIIKIKTRREYNEQ